MMEEEARRIIYSYYTADYHTEDDKFMFVEAMEFRIEEARREGDVVSMAFDLHNLAWFYVEERKFDLYRKYLEKAAECGFHPSYVGLGHLWFYGQTGVVDYAQAYKWFSLGAQCNDDVIRIDCEFMLADMYHYGYYVEKDEDKYREMIERLYIEMKDPDSLNTFAPPEFPADPYINRRLAGIRISEGRGDEALELLYEARRLIAGYIESNPFWWGNIEEIEHVVNMIHELVPDEEVKDIYDLFWFADRERRVKLVFVEDVYLLEVVYVDGGLAIKFDGMWYRDVRSFLEEAMIGRCHVTVLCDMIECEVE